MNSIPNSAISTVSTRCLRQGLIDEWSREQRRPYKGAFGTVQFTALLAQSGPSCRDAALRSSERQQMPFLRRHGAVEQCCIDPLHLGCTAPLADAQPGRLGGGDTLREREPGGTDALAKSG